MIVTALKIDDVDLANDIFYCFVGNHGFPISVSRLQEMMADTKDENVTSEMVYALCAEKILANSKQLKISPKAFSLSQIKTAIEAKEAM